MLFLKNSLLKVALFFACLLLVSLQINAQVMGNASLSPNNQQRQQHHTPNKVNVQKGNSFTISANVLSFVKADRYVVVFGVAEEQATVTKCFEEIQARIKKFTQAIQQFGIPSTAIDVDPITQTRVYEYELSENKAFAKEELKGFEIKYNVAISYTDKALLEKITLEASKQEIYDLIKVEYIVDDPEQVYAQLYKEALSVIESKKTLYQTLTDKEHFANPRIVSIAKQMIPTAQAYQTYTAHETNSVTNDYYHNLRKINARRVSTYYYESLPKTNFDRIINEEYLAPSVQFVVQLELQFDAL